MRRLTLLSLVGAAAALAGCGGSTQLVTVPEQGIASSTPNAGQKIGFPALATTSSGFAWSLGRPDNSVSLAEALAHLRSIAHGVPGGP